jgi:A/G-specific adenine glycosylase
MKEPMEGRFASQLLDWFDRHGRKHLPWQRNPTPYRVWISEVMLQQTQVATAVPYFERFIDRFPEVPPLAAAPLDEVLHLWTGLGYYARARNLHAAAQVIVTTHHGVFPTDVASVQSLPGIGRSTAGAILALACGQRHPILDGNVKRVLARVFGIDGDPSRAPVAAAFWEKAEGCTPTVRIAEYTQAIMDLGATVCTRVRPACDRCPMIADCAARRTGRIESLPGRKRARARPARETTLLIVESVHDGESSILMHRRPARGVWGGLWAPPEFGGEAQALAWCRRELGAAHRVDTPLRPMDHAFTHFDLRLIPLHVTCARQRPEPNDADRIWYPLRCPPRVGLPQPIQRLLTELGAMRDVSR